MPLTIPPGVDAEARINAIFSPTNSLSAASLSGATAVELTCYLTKGTLGVAAETETGTDAVSYTHLTLPTSDLV